MLEAYMDESGIHDGAHACVVAGYFGHEKRWRAFEDRWKKIIQDADEPSLTDFHSVEFWRPDGTRRGVFRLWPDIKADRFISDLLDCIGNHHIYPTCATLKIAAWLRLNKSERMFLTGGRLDLSDQTYRTWITPSAPNQTYFLPFQFAVATPAIRCKDGYVVHYVFDINKQFKTHAATIFEFLQKDQTLSVRDKLGSLRMERSAKAPGLQAADLLAYQS